jgi:hypothetical protein
LAADLGSYCLFIITVLLSMLFVSALRQLFSIDRKNLYFIKVNTSVINFFDNFRWFAKHLFVNPFIIYQDHIQVNVISSIPIFKRDIGLLLYFSDSINIADCQQVLFYQNDEISFSLNDSFLLWHAGLRFLNKIKFYMLWSWQDSFSIFEYQIYKIFKLIFWIVLILESRVFNLKRANFLIFIRKYF